MLGSNSSSNSPYGSDEESESDNPCTAVDRFLCDACRKSTDDLRNDILELRENFYKLFRSNRMVYNLRDPELMPELKKLLPRLEISKVRTLIKAVPEMGKILAKMLVCDRSSSLRLVEAFLSNAAEMQMLRGCAME